ncbi:hypothetical protein BGZ52_000848 [Haplosporangium bisporale]|nr:hypothetical protein BGZ52_000848 [Haplosporangium bisporale]
MSDPKSSARNWAIQSLAEYIGTAMFLYLAVGGADAVTSGVVKGSALSSLGTAFSFGIGPVVTAWAFFRISGSRFNPAITFSSLITGHISVPKAMLYFIAQLLGAMLGVTLMRGTTPSTENIGKVNELMPGESIARGFFLTATLCFVYHMTIPLCGAIFAAALHIQFRFLNHDTVNAGVDAENQAQYMRAQSAVENLHPCTVTAASRTPTAQRQ